VAGCWSKQIFGAKFAERVGQRVSAGLAGSVLGDFGGNHGRAMLPFQFVALVLRAHAVGDTHKAAAVVKDDTASEFQKVLPPARGVKVRNGIFHGVGGRALVRSAACGVLIFVRQHDGDCGLRVVHVECATSGDEFDKAWCAVVVANVERERQAVIASS
jgi:hypothetical protein